MYNFHVYNYFAEYTIGCVNLHNSKGKWEKTFAEKLGQLPGQIN